MEGAGEPSGEDPQTGCEFPTQCSLSESASAENAGHILSQTFIPRKCLPADNPLRYAATVSLDKHPSVRYYRERLSSPVASHEKETKEVETEVKESEAIEKKKKKKKKKLKLKKRKQRKLNRSRSERANGYSRPPPQHEGDEDESSRPRKDMTKRTLMKSSSSPQLRKKDAHPHHHLAKKAIDLVSAGMEETCKELEKADRGLCKRISAAGSERDRQRIGNLRKVLMGCAPKEALVFGKAFSSAMSPLDVSLCALSRQRFYNPNHR